MIKLEINEVLEIHEMLINASGGSHGIRDIELLKSALENAFQTFDGCELYDDDITKISSIAYSVINNHSMIDGNKRLGITLMGVLCKLSNIKLKYNQSELVELGLKIAQKEYLKENIEDWIRRHL
ncbi:type II toxin-antitoxin system death-on-curing family toxin [Clostridium bowmanii]|uniref:type II toxin-antitoxin system death-on-curing family toxin n=1 Tax=Clostridium bowmanii TaxID=132925 RepID=UPI001C0DCE2A|nr:type II toxin-antitoxin system death-on-curing family toxin [Clostridium bowmanii]MBU3190305.1 type II toxin-antitoxin system death-on-curing family toxin [Clostridium bowmanii]MCA1072483.1 type II toxin-antitoxin system death-on-curing family toxin [Clostridium bowmanii]